MSLRVMIWTGSAPSAFDALDVRPRSRRRGCQGPARLRRDTSPRRLRPPCRRAPTRPSCVGNSLETPRKCCLGGRISSPFVLHSERYNGAVLSGNRNPAIATLAAAVLLQFRQSCRFVTPTPSDLPAYRCNLQRVDPGSRGHRRHVARHRRKIGRPGFAISTRRAGRFGCYCSIGVRPRVEGWLSLRSFYGRPAYDATAEAGVYTAPRGAAARHRARVCSTMRSSARRRLGLRRCSRSFSATTRRASRCFAAAGFQPWGAPPARRRIGWRRAGPADPWSPMSIRRRGRARC